MQKGGIVLKIKVLYFLQLFLIIFLFSNAVLPAYAETEPLSYAAYCQLYQDAAKPEKKILVKASDFTSITSDDKKNISVKAYQKKKNVLVWNAPDGSIDYTVKVPETGIYCLEFSYFPIPSNMTAIEFSIAIDGQIPYDIASRAVLNKVYTNCEDIRTDAKGSQIRPAQMQTGIWMDAPLMDTDGLTDEPLLFYLKKGSHKITFDIQKGWFALACFAFYTSAPLPEYTEYQESVQADTAIKDTPSALLRIEGENALYKSDAALYPTSEQSSYLTSPSSTSGMVYNTIGAGCWKKALQSITWQIDSGQLPDGWYKLGIKARQNELRGFYSNRRIYIDNQVLCQELNQVKFYYDSDWQLVSPADENGQAFYFYLKGGQTHTIRMEVISGEIGESIQKLDAAVQKLNTCYRKIIMITSPSPDKYTDYDVHERIPTLLEEFQAISEELKAIQTHIETLSGSEGSEAAALERMYFILDKCIEKPLQIPDYLSQIKDNITALSAWALDYRTQPLEIDYLELASADREFSSVQENCFQAAVFSWKRFYNSFTFLSTTPCVFSDAFKTPFFLLY